MAGEPDDRASVLEVDIERAGEIEVVVARGELDVASVAVLEDALAGIAPAPGATVAVDLKEVDFMDSSGLRALIRADDAAKRGGYRLVVVRGPAPVDRVLQITKMDSHLSIVDSLDSLGAK